MQGIPSNEQRIYVTHMMSRFVIEFWAVSFGELRYHDSTITVPINQFRAISHVIEFCVKYHKFLIISTQIFSIYQIFDNHLCKYWFTEEEWGSMLKFAGQNWRPRKFEKNSNKLIKDAFILIIYKWIIFLLFIIFAFCTFYESSSKSDFFSTFSLPLKNVLRNENDEEGK